ncbi:ceramidase [Lutimaribacter sp. EGI FJ00015]|uniref:Ceramidase n=1 Tax=Lutimaribacter degradans TaxID=2945989 RepID=A0ACC5ZWL4_9RHOB|nr:ceramidase domain-containing protein [Lutimaribacter sp. EGI FJ00013]MCM2562697.1 ceramidase [Lutimaribacter sp. EGI FJ00013]MCO0613854.1 ceramidase [Lutimaribacter sp. EGI FJ00015]MCO0636663.1 ceramidase [Lutimaribacter sp. EGI FJ00014]
MDWTRQIDSYCERLGPDYWAEPVNALTNLAFIIAAAILWPQVRGLPLARALCAVLAVIGVGSWLFHTHATAWAAMADVLPILGFILLYIYTANRAYWGLRPWPALGLTALFFPYAAVTVPLFQMVPGLGSSAGYAPVPLLILVYALLLRRRLPRVSRGLAIGAGILVVSLFFRTIDMQVCRAVPTGTHFLWHVLNATMLGWMIAVYRRHMLAGAGARR